jgi:hypothetical protein
MIIENILDQTDHNNITFYPTYIRQFSFSKMNKLVTCETKYFTFDYTFITLICMSVLPVVTTKHIMTIPCNPSTLESRVRKPLQKIILDRSQLSFLMVRNS